MNTEPSQKSLKIQLRKKLRQQRAQIEAPDRARWDQGINKALVELAVRSGPATIAAYLSFDGEPDLAPALRELENKGIRLVLPVVQDIPGKSTIQFHAWSTSSPLKPNRYGIDEPADTPLVPVTEIDLVLVPLVGWDESGGRLGMGASFYDRLFQPFADSNKPSRIGVAYELQKLAAVPSEPWDVSLHGMLTENGRFTFTA